MNTRVGAMLEQAKVLPAGARGTPLDALGELFSPPDAQWREAWARESGDRLAAYEAGKVEADDFDVAKARLRKEFLG